jgi:hypothetical protein
MRNFEQYPHIGYRTHCNDPVVFVAVGDGAPGDFQLPDDAKRKLSVDVIHDGNVIPEEMLVDPQGARIADDAFWEYYVKERDWGAGLVAGELARHLGLGGYWNVEIARVLMDFGRFPGITPADASYQSRHAIAYPFSDLLGFDQKRRILEHYYDTISAHFNTIVERSQVKLAIHTYDTYNQSGTLRPPLSILTRCVGYQVRSEMPYDVFDPLFPDILGEFTCDRILRDRISLTLERAGLHTEHNYPYLLPDGSVEVRSQVWNFFRFARETFEHECPETRADVAYIRVWDMLLDTNLRSSESEMLRSYLHAFRRVPAEREAQFEAARRAYDRIAHFLGRDEYLIAERYRQSLSRPSALGIEVRKDLVFEFDDKGRPVAPRKREASKIASFIARAIKVYFTRDAPAHRVFSSEIPTLH